MNKKTVKCYLYESTLLTLTLCDIVTDYTINIPLLTAIKLASSQYCSSQDVRRIARPIFRKVYGENSCQLKLTIESLPRSVTEETRQIRAIHLQIYPSKTNLLSRNLQLENIFPSLESCFICFGSYNKNGRKNGDDVLKLVKKLSKSIPFLWILIEYGHGFDREKSLKRFNVMFKRMNLLESCVLIHNVESTDCDSNMPSRHTLTRSFKKISWKNTIDGGSDSEKAYETYEPSYNKIELDYDIDKF